MGFIFKHSGKNPGLYINYRHLRFSPETVIVISVLI